MFRQSARFAITALVLMTLLVGSALARCNPRPTVTFVSDGTPEGSFAAVSWEPCDGTSWEVCRKPVRLHPGKGELPLEDCEIVEQSSILVPWGEARHFVIRWLDGIREGEAYTLHFNWPAL
jgi:hypothetical protein